MGSHNHILMGRDPLSSVPFFPPQSFPPCPFGKILSLDSPIGKDPVYSETPDHRKRERGRGRDFCTSPYLWEWVTRDRGIRCLQFNETLSHPASPAYSGSYEPNKCGLETLGKGVGSSLLKKRPMRAVCREGALQFPTKAKSSSTGRAWTGLSRSGNWGSGASAPGH